MEEQESVTSLRDRRNKTQEWVASRMNVHPSVISQYEHGTTKPSYKRLESYAKALNVSVKRLLTALAVTERQSVERAAAKKALTDTAPVVAEQGPSQN
jgi:transcriptional regulator with XRE-family HTH domain